MQDDIYSQLRLNDQGNSIVPYGQHLVNAGYDPVTNPPSLGGVVNALPRAPQPEIIEPRPEYVEGFDWENFIGTSFVLLLMVVGLVGTVIFLIWLNNNVLAHFHYCC